MRKRLQEQERISTRETFRLFGEALGYVKPLRGRFSVKVGLTILAVLPMVLLPFPIKILGDLECLQHRRME